MARRHICFTIDSCSADPNLLNTTFSELPTQHKSFNIIKLDNGYFAAQPNNRMLIYDKSYSPKQLKFSDFKVSSIEYSVEDKQKITFGDDDEFFSKRNKDLVKQIEIQKMIHLITKYRRSVLKPYLRCQFF